ncbi:putative peptidyl-tRNA hydrolase PTRHD1 isoform X2 [Anopheles arabiensis]|uniref:putative peptidyl-tRNA hydrolase PTRHD1 isoform X2 n=1 Tax=Anopheles arabiensis TaxID=7173 RepID=UPI001AAD992B|nr:putative peptidyl-tRNA hydrolase PTRHD1 isoform X2 [Anopheles arabiensis]
MCAAKLVQYVIVNGEIAKSWPKGALIAQCCHAVAAVGHLYASDPDTVEYFKDLDNMHKVVLEHSQRLTTSWEKFTGSHIKWTHAQYFLHSGVQRLWLWRKQRVQDLSV